MKFMKLQDLLVNETKWLQGCYSKDKYGNTVNPHSDLACRWCLVGAIQKCYYPIPSKVWYKIADHLNENPIAWNDEPGRKFSDIRKLIEDLNL